jgi:hypothetical protein
MRPAHRDKAPGGAPGRRRGDAADRAVGPPPCIYTRPAVRTPSHDQDPLWKLRHAFAGVAIALLLSMLVAAFAGRYIGDAAGGDYDLRVTIYLVLLAHVVAGAIVLFVRVARHETRPLSMRRVLVWFASLWLWPLLLAAGRRTPPS